VIGEKKKKEDVYNMGRHLWQKRRKKRTEQREEKKKIELARNYLILWD
jgi:hypothetical protein